MITETDKDEIIKSLLFVISTLRIELKNKIYEIAELKNRIEGLERANETMFRKGGKKG